jgi:hypothetical protein
MSMQRKRRASSGADLNEEAQQDKPSAAPTADRLPNKSPGGTDGDGYFRRLYSQPPDFKELSRLDPEFASVFVLPP